MMFETNTASCGGFPGISNSYGAALWGLDYALLMAYNNFTGALFHVGGRDVFYNVSYLNILAKNILTSSLAFHTLVFYDSYAEIVLTLAYSTAYE